MNPIDIVIYRDIFSSSNALYYMYHIFPGFPLLELLMSPLQHHQFSHSKTYRIIYQVKSICSNGRWYSISSPSQVSACQNSTRFRRQTSTRRCWYWQVIHPTQTHARTHFINHISRTAMESAVQYQIFPLRQHASSRQYMPAASTSPSMTHSLTPKQASASPSHKM